ncbi:hypothetical protein CXG81DRAFT_19747 [Caulochytrium protostelioides]|uniref:Uncharacterized protein n=1 Tax=Caulochytrium protostelioides TaxID=1555241 RepID=A0A4P9X595_9FUNG|nr:hypothetical protein CXG81DRAFT_19747 [Caulochytrium protostelioides]|eukprot:RKP00283.1 hypothetical protein CXG81DRAFT_19747 [Caulochytrium protostelioides]
MAKRKGRKGRKSSGAPMDPASTAEPETPTSAGQPSSSNLGDGNPSPEVSAQSFQPEPESAGPLVGSTNSMTGPDGSTVDRQAGDPSASLEGRSDAPTLPPALVDAATDEKKVVDATVEVSGSQELGSSSGSGGAVPRGRDEFAQFYIGLDGLPTGIIRPDHSSSENVPTQVSAGSAHGTPPGGTSMTASWGHPLEHSSLGLPGPVSSPQADAGPFDAPESVAEMPGDSPTTQPGPYGLSQVHVPYPDSQGSPSSDGDARWPYQAPSSDGATTPPGLPYPLHNSIPVSPHDLSALGAPLFGSDGPQGETFEMPDASHFSVQAASSSPRGNPPVYNQQGLQPGWWLPIAGSEHGGSNEYGGSNGYGEYEQNMHRDAPPSYGQYTLDAVHHNGHPVHEIGNSASEEPSSGSTVGPHAVDTNMLPSHPHWLEPMPPRNLQPEAPSRSGSRNQPAVSGARAAAGEVAGVPLLSDLGVLTQQTTTLALGA